MALFGIMAPGSVNSATDNIESFVAKDSVTSDTSSHLIELLPQNHKFFLSHLVSQYGLDSVLIPLANCESTFRDICIIDTNGKLSCGMFQFQKTTFERYCPDLKWHDSVKSDAMCADRMIVKGLLKENWKTCSKKIAPI